jgi:phthiocerol/phenolphthiocerol synthesis type-I polyketide synthase E
MSTDSLDGIAIVGMMGRFPQAPDLNQFWCNLRDGVEAVSFFSDAELQAAGVAPSVLRNPNYVKAKAVLENADLFDASFFEFSPREAELTDPQIRVFLECAWEVLENAAYDPDRFPGLLGVYAGMSFSSYMLNAFAGTAGARNFDTFRALLGSDKDYLSTWVSYKLNLHGPSFNIQTACSTALAAVHLACRALITFECDMALAGGISIAVPQRSGYMYEPGSIFSSDGHCRAFDARSDGSMAGEGVGVVLLKRLEDALAAGDTIHAIIRGSAVNNDGRRKVGYTAPSVNGQAEAVSMALANAQIEKLNIAYIEAHGSGTKVGDPIEVSALNHVYAGNSAAPGSIAIGSVKSNIGHLGPAAGIAGLLKTVLAIQHGQIPPSLHFEFPNPQIRFERGPLRVNNVLAPWPVHNRPRRAGVSSFGVGGTNVHVIVEQAPAAAVTDSAKPWQLLTLSARTATALNKMTERMGKHLRENPDQNFADVAFTLHVGRKAFEHRRAVICRDARHAVELLESRAGVAAGLASSSPRSIAFLLPGLGDHYIDMGRGLYESEPEFKNQIDFCCEFLRPLLNFDLRTVMYPERAIRRQDETAANKRLDFRKMVLSGSENGSGENGLQRTVWAQPALFVLEFALAKLWMNWGIIPESMLGYSIGEYVAATLAGVISIEDSLRLLADRASRIEALDPGAMLAIGADEDTVRAMLPAEVSVAGTNGPSLCVVSGPAAAIAALERSIVEKRELVCRSLKTAHAFHSPMMGPVAAALTEKARSIRLHPPQIPYISNVTGTWITSEDATDPAYWARHLCQPVRFAEGLRELCSKSLPILLEVGPGQMLSSLAEQYLGGMDTRNRLILPSLPHASDHKPDRAFVLQSLAQLWISGIEPNWSAVHQGERRGRLPLPTYPFERKRYWLAPRMPLIPEPAKDVEEIRPVDGAEYVAPTAMPEPVEGNGLYSRPDLGVEYAAATNEVEQKIISIWEKLLGTGPIGLYDNFLRLGGNSLLAIRVAAELQSAFQVEFPIQALMTASTPAELALVIEDALITMIEGMNETEIS